MKKFTRTLILVSFLLLVVLVASGVQAQTSSVYVITIKGTINPVLVDYVERGIVEAEDNGAHALIIQMDTPGGLDTAMRDIIKLMVNAHVPVVVYVAPSGSRAASAGVFITMAAHIAAMAPNTTIGAAHPVSSTGEDIEGALGDKTTNEAAEYIVGIAKLRGRNETWARSAVRRSVAPNQDDRL